MEKSVIGGLWFLSSALLSTWANTSYLLLFKDPLLHTFVRFGGSAVAGAMTLLSSGEVIWSEIPRLLINVATPAVLLWIANYANSLALQQAGITLTYVLKAGIPVFTVIVCTFNGQKFPFIIYVSLIPICFGVALACMGDLSFNPIGFLAGIASAISQTFMNISIKSVRAQTGYSGMKAFFGMAVVCTLITFPFMLFYEAIISVRQPQDLNLRSTEILLQVFDSLRGGDSWPLLLTLIAALAYHIEYVLNFVFVGYVSSVTFSVSDIARRIAIITTGSVLFKKSLTAMNWTGIVIALGGVLWYTYLESAVNKKK